MELINELTKCLGSMDYSMFDEDCINELLDSRDSAPYDKEWCRVEKEIAALKNDQNYNEEIEKEQSKVRETVFLTVGRNVGGELSGYVSDDFGLIYDSLVLNYRDEWLDKLIEEYKNQRIPAGEL